MAGVRGVSANNTQALAALDQISQVLSRARQPIGNAQAGLLVEAATTAARDAGAAAARAGMRVRTRVVPSPGGAQVSFSGPGAPQVAAEFEEQFYRRLPEVTGRLRAQVAATLRPR